MQVLRNEGSAVEFVGSLCARFGLVLEYADDLVNGWDADKDDQGYKGSSHQKCSEIQRQMRDLIVNEIKENGESRIDDDPDLHRSDQSRLRLHEQSSVYVKMNLQSYLMAMHWG